MIHATNSLDSQNTVTNSLLTSKAKARRVLAEKDATIAALKKEGGGRGGDLGDMTRGDDDEPHFE